MDPSLSCTPSVSIAIDSSLRQRRGDAWIERSLRRAVRSTRVEWDESGEAFRILGPDTSYHCVDPHLVEVLKRFDGGIRSIDAKEYWSEGRWFDLCFEDSWSGMLAARALRGTNPATDLVLIHLDDHTDMMPTLLTCDGDQLLDPSRRALFDAENWEHWKRSIRTGCIGIGSFVTAMYYMSRPVHVRHLNGYRTSDYRSYDVAVRQWRTPVIPALSFAAVRKCTKPESRTLGTYRGGADPARLFESLPHGQTIVHIDLDYFINDFNGNPGASVSCGLEEQRRLALHKIERFFCALSTRRQHIDRWIVATSPGFCSAVHWEWLLAALESKICEYGG